jgi:signal peptidase II
VKLKYLVLSGLVALIVVIDQWTKIIVDQRFRLGESLPVVNEFFNLTYIRNTGAAFGLFANADPIFRVPFFTIIPILALVAIGYMFKKIPPNDIRLSTALSLVVGGAIGNFIDRVFLGYVIDFLDFHWRYLYHFPAFNVADSAICVGVGVLMLDLLIQNPESGTEDSKDASTVD